MLMGSVSREMLQRAPCPVAVVHPVAVALTADAPTHADVLTDALLPS
jgi:hypothetical protein